MKSKLSRLAYLNIFRKFFVFYYYLIDNLKNKQYDLIFIAIKYLLFKKSNSKDLIVQTNLGRFFIRKNTIDFKLVNSAYEYNVIRVFEKYLHNADVFLDIGANIGTYSVIASKQSIKTWAFEPILTNRDSLLKNIKLNKIEALIEVLDYGLGSHEKLEEFYFNRLKPGASGVHKFKNAAEQIEVPIKVFDECFKANQFKDIKLLVKIDVEGMEIDVLKGMNELINAAKDLNIIIESKHVGEETIKNHLSNLGNFEFELIDEFNLSAIKRN